MSYPQTNQCQEDYCLGSAVQDSMTPGFQPFSPSQDQDYTNPCSDISVQNHGSAIDSNFHQPQEQLEKEIEHLNQSGFQSVSPLHGAPGTYNSFFIVQ
jgi:hypothetical protein